MSRTLGWILVAMVAVSAGIGAAVGLGLFWGGDGHAPAHPVTLAATGISSTPVPIAPEADASVPVAPDEDEAPVAVLQPHVERGATPESVEERAIPTRSATAAIGPSGPVAVSVRQLTSAGAEYVGQEVVLTGRILNLCVRGCQLSLDDGTGVMSVELVDDALSNTIPFRSVGRQIEVTGVFRLIPRPHVSVERPDGWRFP